MGVDFKILDNGDWDVTTLVSDDAKVLQDVKTQLLSIKGDAFWSLENGIDMNYFLSGSDKEKQGIILQVILGVEGVKNATITQFETKGTLQTVYFTFTTITNAYSANIVI